jgi:cyclic dehypoxanthinyl futalosine synthase
MNFDLIYAGANDLGSSMIEENVVLVVGASIKLPSYDMKRSFAEAGFQPHLRTQNYPFIDFPPVVEKFIV